MKALVCRAAGEIEFVDAPAPAPAPGESLIKVDSCGVCGSDMHAFLGHDERRPPPLILGHEAAGEVVGGEKLGARVAVNPLVVCDFLSPRAPCAMCAAGRDNLCARRQILSMAPRPGAFAEFVCAPGGNLFELPPSFPFAKAALFEPLACGRRAARLAAELSPTAIEKCETLVIGGGAIGLGCALFLARAGAARVAIIEANPLRQKTLSRATAFAGIDVAAPGDSARSAHVVVDAVGNAGSREAAFGLVAAGGLIAHIGLGGGAGGVDSRRLTLQEIVFCGSYTYTKKDFEETARACLSGELGDLDWPQIRPLREGAAVFAAAVKGEIAAPKVILSP